MSLNLNAKSKDVLLNLRQTPTSISLALICDHNGEIHELRGKEAKRAMYAYMYWLREIYCGVFETPEDANDRHTIYNEHIEYLKPYIENDDLVVWVM